MLLKHCIVIPVDITTKNEDGVIHVAQHKDTVSFVRLKPIIHSLILSKFQLKNIHVVAAMLDPRFKGRIVTRFGVSSNLFEQAREILIVRMLKKGDQEQQATKEEPADPSKKKSKQMDSPSSKYTLDGDEFSEQESEAGDDGVGGAVATRRHIEAELDTYLRYKVTKQDEVILEQSLLFWWKSKSAKIEGWPLIAQVRVMSCASQLLVQNLNATFPMRET